MQNNDFTGTTDHAWPKIIALILQYRNISPDFNEFCGKLEDKVQQQTSRDMQAFYTALMVTFYEKIYNMKPYEADAIVNDKMKFGPLWNEWTEAVMKAGIEHSHE